MRPPRKDSAAWVREANRLNRESRRTFPRECSPQRPRVRREHPRAGSRYELALARQIALEAIPVYEVQYRFAAELGRQFRFDFAWPALKVAAEVDGGRWLVRRGKNGQPVPVGQHMHLEDYRKLNLAAKLGWRVMRFSPEMIQSGEAILELRAMVGGLPS